MTLKNTYSTGAIAAILGVHIDTVRRFCDNGELMFEKGLLSTHRRIRPDALETFMLQRGVSREAINNCMGKLMIAIDKKDDSNAGTSIL